MHLWDWRLWIIVGVAGALSLWWDKRRKERATPGAVPVVFVRAVSSGSNTFKNIVVLLVVAGLGWFFWWATHTKFWP
jgi:hypothetical protein